jgi:hypothetical protein
MGTRPAVLPAQIDSLLKPNGVKGPPGPLRGAGAEPLAFPQAICAAIASMMTPVKIIAIAAMWIGVIGSWKA